MKLKHVVIGFFAILLTSCMDIFETINLNADGSGTYIIKMEMGEMVSMMANMAGSEKSSNKKKKELMDSSFSYATTVDTMKNLSAEEKRVLRKAGGKLHVDEAKGEMWVEMKFPFANATDFALIQQSMDNNNTKDFGVLDKLLGGKTKDMDKMGMGDDIKNGNDGLPMPKTSYALTANSFTRKTITPPQQTNANTEEKKEEDEMTKKMMAMMEMNMSFTLNLPKAATKIDAKDAVVSEDKKQIKFKKKVNIEEVTKAALFNCYIEF